MSKYVSQFLGLRSVPDILGAVGYLGNKPEKEISEAIAMIHTIRKVALDHPYEYQLVDLCSGNALVPVIAAHLLPLTFCLAIDKRHRERNWEQVRHFAYIEKDIYDLGERHFVTPTILTAVHCCRELAEKVIQIYNQYDPIRYLFLMPCCIGDIDTPLLRLIKEESNTDLAWTVKLVLQCTGKVSISHDRHILSPKNYIIKARKEDD